MMLLYATHDLLLHLLLYHQSLGRRRIGETLLSKHKLLLFPFCLLLINFILLLLFFYLKRRAMWHFLDSITRQQESGSCSHTTHVSSHRVSRCAIFYTWVNISGKKKNLPRSQMLFTVSNKAEGVDTSCALSQTMMNPVTDFESWQPYWMSRTSKLIDSRLLYPE